MKLGIQLYSVRNGMAADPRGTLKKVIDAGYKHIEAANHDAAKDFGLGFGISASETKKMMEENGSAVLGAHIMPCTAEHMPKVAAYYREIGAKYLIDAIETFDGIGQVREKCAAFNEVGAICRDYGIQFLYHNHFQEFQMMEGKTILDWILELTDPALMGIELDVYWVMRAGNDPIATLKKIGDRVKLVHQKDFTKGYESEMNILQAALERGGPIDMDAIIELIKPETFTEIGEGIMDIQKIIDTANSATAAEYLVLEQDFTGLTEFESIKKSYLNLAKYKGIEA